MDRLLGLPWQVGGQAGDLLCEDPRPNQANMGLVSAAGQFPIVVLL